MRIVSSFKDYYDSVQKLGQSGDTTYLRKTIRLRNPTEYVLSDIKYPHEEISLKEGLLKYKQLEFVIDFCDKLAPDSILKPIGWDKDHYIIPSNTSGQPPWLQHLIGNKEIYFSILRGIVFFSGEVIPVLVLRKFKKGVSDYNLNNSTYIYSQSQLDSIINCNDVILSKDKYDLIVNWLNEIKTSNTNFLIQNKIINVFVLNYDRYSRRYRKNILNMLDLIINPCLSDLQFQKKYDANTTFQKLDSYICGTLAYPQNELIEVSNEQKIVKHGFDPIYGFRKRKES